MPAQVKQKDGAARLDELLAQADQAAHRLTADTAEQQASSEYAARLYREAQAEPEAEQQAETWNGFEMELLGRAARLVGVGHERPVSGTGPATDSGRGRPALSGMTGVLPIRRSASPARSSSPT